MTLFGLEMTAFDWIVLVVLILAFVVTGSIAANKNYYLTVLGRDVERLDKRLDELQRRVDRVEDDVDDMKRGKPAK